MTSVKGKTVYYKKTAPAREVLESIDTILLFFAENDCESIPEMFDMCGISRSGGYNIITKEGIDLTPVKELLIKDRFLDSTWFDNEYAFEEGEKYREYKAGFFVTNYGTPLKLKKKLYCGVEFTKLVEDKTCICKMFSRILSNNIYVHKAVASVWVDNPFPLTYTRVGHKGVNTLDNSYLNLYWKY